MLNNFNTMLKKIEDEIYGVGQKIIKANELSLEAIKNGDSMLFLKAKNGINNVAHTLNRIDNAIVKGLALYQPEAKDLRSMVSYLKITNELLRASSNTKKFIKNFSKFLNDSAVDMANILEFSIPLHTSSIQAMKTSIEMIKINNKEEIEKAFQKVIVEENKSDDLYGMVEKNLLKILSERVELSKDYVDILSSLRRLEKIVNRASSIANLLIFAEIGGELHQV